MKKFYALFVARNREFLRDRSTLGWNFMFPFLVILALSLVFTGSDRNLYKVGLMGAAGENGANIIGKFLDTRHVQFVPVTDIEQAKERVRRHQYDMLLRTEAPVRYWINTSNPKGYFLERVLWGSGSSSPIEREELNGREIRYIDWLVPGVLAMNVMFSCMWGVGYVIVRYRKSGILRRLKAAPITAFQFLSAQVASRLILVMTVTVILYFGSDFVLDFYLVGSLFNLFVMFCIGSVCLISLSILMASRTHSLELAGGLLNLATWPMMILSGVWFSMEGSNPWMILFSKMLPLTHFVNGARSIMVDGAQLTDLGMEIGVLLGLTVLFLGISSVLFRWE